MAITSPPQGSDGNFYGTTVEGGNYKHGDPNGNGTVYKLAVAPALLAPVQLSLSLSSVSVGAAFTLTYTVANATSDTLQYCFATNNAGSATWTGVKTGKTTAQTSSLTAPSANGAYTYALTCGGMESGFATLTVTGGKNSTAASVAAAPNPATVTHSSGSAPPTGKVNFAVGTTAIGSGTVNSSGVATLSATTNGIAPGSYPVVATYSGDATYEASSSPATTVTLNQAPTSTTLTASPNPVTPPAKCTLKATVKRNASGAAGIATGSVTFSVGTTTIGTASLNGSGVATLSASTSGIAAGNYPVTAKYNGDASDVGSTSTAVTVTVE